MNRAIPVLRYSLLDKLVAAFDVYVDHSVLADLLLQRGEQLKRGAESTRLKGGDSGIELLTSGQFLDTMLFFFAIEYFEELGTH